MVKKIDKELLNRILGNSLAVFVFYAVLMIVLAFIFLLVFQTQVTQGDSILLSEISHFGINGQECEDFLVTFALNPLIILGWIVAIAATLTLPALAFIGIYQEVNKNNKNKN